MSDNPTVLKCGKENCNFKRTTEHEYCEKHKRCVFENDTALLGKKVCKNVIRGCREQLEMDNKFSKCGPCLEKERDKDRIKREKMNEKATLLENSEETNRVCRTCHKEKDIDMFNGDKSITKTCKPCRDINKIRDSKRDKEHRNEVARKAELNPERRNQKKKWKEDNYIVVAGHWVKEHDPLMIRRILYSKYKRSANKRNLPFAIDFDFFCATVNVSCYYCGILQEQGFNGLDRKNSMLGYTNDNCVSCCQICNYMKGALDNDIFVKRAEHILSYNNKVEIIRLSPELFGNHKNINFASYKCGAKKRNLAFELDRGRFDSIRNEKCYLCGKENSNEHKNGIDRVDSNVGYIVENCRACCGECNLMKKEFSYDEVMTKFSLIYEKHKDCIGSMVLTDTQNRILVKQSRRTR